MNSTVSNRLCGKNLYDCNWINKHFWMQKCWRVQQAVWPTSVPIRRLNQMKKISMKKWLKWSDVQLRHVQLFATSWTRACQAPLSMGFSRQEYWSSCWCLSPRDLPDPGIEPGSPALQADSLPSEPPGKSRTLLLEFPKCFQAISLVCSCLVWWRNG